MSSRETEKTLMSQNFMNCNSMNICGLAVTCVKLLKSLNHVQTARMILQWYVQVELLS